MAILALFRWQADGDALVAAYDREMKNAPAVTLDQGRRTPHVFAHAGDEAVVVDLWESEEDFHRMMDDPEFRQSVAAAAWPSEPDVRIYEIHAAMP